jgi:hypothetical protein
VSYVAGQSVKFVDALAKALGIAKPIKGLVLRARVGDIVRVEVESFLETGEDERVAGVIERFELNPVAKAEADPVSVVGRYLLFAFDPDHRKGGWHDFVGAFDTASLAVEAAHGISGRTDLWFWHVVDSRYMAIIEHNLA